MRPDGRRVLRPLPTPTTPVPARSATTGGGIEAGVEPPLTSRGATIGRPAAPLAVDDTPASSSCFSAPLLCSHRGLRTNFDAGVILGNPGQGGEACHFGRALGSWGDQLPAVRFSGRGRVLHVMQGLSRMKGGVEQGLIISGL